MSNNVNNQIPVFVDNQVLTSTQLNDLANYLDQQSRLSNVKLVGVGVMCGLVPSFVPDPTARPLPGFPMPGTVRVTSGAGVTTEGYLLQLADTVYDRYRPYLLPEGGDYAPFIDPVTLQQYPMYEALPDDYVVPLTEPTPPGDINSDFVADKVAVLFFESVLIDLQSCIGKSCDDLGLTRTYNTRLLLIDKAVIDEMVTENHLAYDLNFPGKFDLPDYAIRRALFDPTQLHSKDYFKFSEQFRDALKDTYSGDPLNPLTSPGIIESIRYTYTVFQGLLESVYPDGDPLPYSIIPKGGKVEWNNIISGASNSTGPGYLGIQYMYDFVKDLVLAYDEFRNVAFDLMSECCVSSALFPRHLFLGEIIPLSDCKPSKYRHEFIAAPVTHEQRVARETLIELHQRMVLLLKMFNPSRIHNPPTATTGVLPMRITPSYEKQSWLSQRAIPYYYDPNKPDAELNITLESVWNSLNKLQCKSSGGQFPVLAYDNQEGSPFVPTTRVKTPLFFNRDPYNFFRIEGHLRWDVTTALTEINLWKDTFDLPFNVIALRLGGQSTTTEILARCNFDDLRSQYIAARRELDCFLRRYYDHFFEVKNGVIGPKGFPQFLKQMVADATVEGGASSVAFMPASSTATAASSSAATQDPKAAVDPALQLRQAFSSAIAIRFYDPRPLSDVSSDLNTAFANLLIAMNNVFTQMPSELDQFNFGNDVNVTANSFIKSYIAAMNYSISIKTLINEALDQIVHSTHNRFPKEMYFMLSQWASENMWFINAFITNCKFRDLEVIYYELQYRINYLKTNDPTVFSNFIEKNPGVQHDAGVQPGGTFILVYPGAPLTIQSKGRDVATAIQVNIASLNVELANFTAKPELTASEQLRKQTVEADLCNLYKDQVMLTQDVIEPKVIIPKVAVASPKPIFRINLTERDVIADFSLPYLTTCNCDCDDIPSPTTSQLSMPALALPGFYEFNLGDYAWIDDRIVSTSGCYDSGEALPSLTIQANPLYASSSDGNKIRLLIVVNANSGSVGTSFTTAKGGQVSVIDFSTSTQAFKYTPSRTFLGADYFDYVFEVYDNVGNVKLRSNRARMTVIVVPRCTAKTVAINTAIAESAAITPAFTA